MSCKRYQRLLHLNRSGEMSAHEADELRQHLRLCEACSLEVQRIERADEFLDRLGAFSPVPGDPEKLTADIVWRVRAESTRPKTLNLLDRFFDFFLIPSVRYSAVAVISLVIFSSATQLATTLNDIVDLEKRMASTIRHDGTAATYTMQSKALEEVAKSERGKPLAENLSLTMTNDRIDVSAKDVEQYLSEYNLTDLSTLLGSSALGIDKKTLEKIINEVKATVERSFRFDGKGA